MVIDTEIDTTNLVTLELPLEIKARRFLEESTHPAMFAVSIRLLSQVGGAYKLSELCLIAMDP